jgi:hypothetical protein
MTNRQVAEFRQSISVRMQIGVIKVPEGTTVEEFVVDRLWEQNEERGVLAGRVSHVTEFEFSDLTDS